MKQTAIVLAMLLLTGCASGGTGTEPAAETAPAESSISEQAETEPAEPDNTIPRKPSSCHSV